MSGKPSVHSSAVRAVVPWRIALVACVVRVDEQRGAARAASSRLEPERRRRRRSSADTSPVIRSCGVVSALPIWLRAARVGDDDVGERAADVAA